MFAMNGTIRRLTDELREGHAITLEVGSGPKGQRAENVQLG